jgi:uncharacterized protein
MKLFVTAKPRAKTTYVKQIDKENFVVSVKEVAEDGRANDAVIRALAEFLQIEPYQLRITSGHTARKKIIEIL